MIGTALNRTDMRKVNLLHVHTPYIVYSTLFGCHGIVIVLPKVVDHMAGLVQPWVSDTIKSAWIIAFLNIQCCPHGRPTMRHIIDLSKLQY